MENKIYDNLTKKKFNSPDKGTVRLKSPYIGFLNSSNIFLSQLAFQNVENMYMNILLEQLQKKNNIIQQEFDESKCIEMIKSFQCDVEIDSNWIFFFNNDIRGQTNPRLLYKIFFNVKSKYITSFLKLLLDNLMPLPIFGKVTKSYRLQKEEEDFSDHQKYINWLKAPKLVLYFHDDSKSEQEMIDMIQNYVMVILSNISDELIYEISYDCYYSEDLKKITCGQSFTLPINKLMFLSQGGYAESGRLDIVRDNPLKLKDKFEGTNFYKYKDAIEFNLPFYKKKYLKYKNKYLKLKST